MRLAAWQSLTIQISSYKNALSTAPMTTFLFAPHAAAIFLALAVEPLLGIVVSEVALEIGEKHLRLRAATKNGRDSEQRESPGTRAGAAF
jgi:hypothetical protein